MSYVQVFVCDMCSLSYVVCVIFSLCHAQFKKSLWVWDPRIGPCRELNSAPGSPRATGPTNCFLLGFVRAAEVCVLLFVQVPLLSGALFCRGPVAREIISRKMHVDATHIFIFLRCQWTEPLRKSSAQSWCRGASWGSVLVV